VKKDRWRPHLTVVNLGTNDRTAERDVFYEAYIAYIRTIRRDYRRTHIVCMRPFNGAHAEEIAAVVDAFHRAGDKRVHYVDTTGWIDPKTDTTDGIHPNVEGHAKAARKLAQAIANLF
jgi:lysophospholipase L1-like esterase